MDSNNCMSQDFVPQSTDSFFQDGMVLRMHLRPARFPLTEQFSLTEHIVYQNKALGAVLVNKPAGLPSHATVDNATENVLYRVQKYCSVKSASLPQRLDTETSGLLWVATRKSSASYMGRLLQSGGKGLSLSPSCGVGGGIQKRYRCLVCCASLESWEKLESHRNQNSIVTHYVDASSRAPKRFVTTFPECMGGLDENDKRDNTSKHGVAKWQECRLKIIGLTNPRSLVHENVEDVVLTGKIWGDATNKPPSARFVTQVEVELLTGRTHQIRGQMSQMGCPIVGDPLYGGSLEKIGERVGERPFRMALQCFYTSVVVPKEMLDDGISSLKKGKGVVATKNDREHNILEFFLEQAWWSDGLLKTGEFQEIC